MIDIKVIDNFLTKQEHAEIYKELNGETGLFPWFYSDCVNHNNGKTIFKKSKKNVVSKENRLVLFDGRLEHCGTTSTNSKKRIVINLNFFNKEMGK